MIMSGLRMRAFIGFAGLAFAGLLSGACSSSNDNGVDGGGNHGGTGGSGGGSGNACMAASKKLITDFAAGAGTGLSTSAPYTFQDTGLTAPVLDTTGGSLKITFNTGAPTTMYPYAGVGVPFDGCVDISSSTGVKFNVSGTLSAGCTIQFSVIDEFHSATPPLGMCSGSCYPGGKVFDVPATATDVTVNFADLPQGGVGTATGVNAVVPTNAIGVQWQLNVATAGCTGTVTIDNVTLVP
jgi:hypothetical protein